MLALHATRDYSKKIEVNILPCRIHRNGPSKVPKRYWSPVTEQGVLNTVDYLPNKRFAAKGDRWKQDSLFPRP